MGPGRLVVFGSRDGTAPLTGDTGDFTSMVGVSISIGGSSCYGSMFLQSVEPNALIPIIRHLEISKWQQGEAQHFEIGKAILTAQGWKRLKAMVAEFRAGLEGIRSFIEISGYASPTGDSQMNLYLSQDRAQAVFNALYQLLGVATRTPSHQSIVRGYGMEPSLLVGNLQHGQENAAWRRVDLRLNGVLVAQFQGS